MDAVLADWQAANIPLKTRAALRLLECITLNPPQLDGQFITELRRDGLDDAAMREAANVSFHFNMINRLADAFDFEVLDTRQQIIQTKMLNRTGRMLKGAETDPIWIQDVDGQIRPTQLAQARAQLLSAPGKVTPSLRQAVEAHVAQQRGHTRVDPAPIPEELSKYLNKLAISAYKITDKDINTLRGNGYEDEAIYEITIAGAFGAALVGVEQLFNVLYGATD